MTTSTNSEMIHNTDTTRDSKGTAHGVPKDHSNMDSGGWKLGGPKDNSDEKSATIRGKNTTIDRENPGGKHNIITRHDLDMNPAIHHTKRYI